MNFTTTTEIARKGSKIFGEYDEAIVLSNNKPIGALLSYRLYEKLKKSGYLEDVKDIENDYKNILGESLKEWNSEENDNLFA